jgi:hypothetical protein
MLDPLAAVGLAANIVQFLDFTFKLFTDTRDIYKSASGHSAKGTSLSAIADNLRSLSEGLLLSSVRVNTSAGSDLRSLAVQAKTVAEEIRDAISIVRPKKPHSFWQSFKAVLKEIYNDEKIKGLLSEITSLQNSLTLRLLSILL